MSGGYEYEVVGDAIQDLLCPICLNLMKNAMELECGHAMCQTCLQNLEASSKERGYGFACPSCQQEIHSERVNPNKTINRIVLGVKVKCENLIKGCAWIGELSNMLYHLQKECNFQLLNCTFEHCKETIERHMLCSHQEECLYQPVTCEYCSVTCLKLEMEDHYNACDKYPICCPNKCSMNKMERNMVGDHRKCCSNEVISCEFLPFGCHLESARKYMPQHDSDASEYHLSLTLKSVNDVTEKKINELTAEIRQLRVKNLEVSRTIKCMRNEETKRVLQEEKWYTAKLLDRIKLEMKSKCVRIEPPVEDMVKEFDKKFWLIIKGLPWLRNKLKEICARDDAANREMFNAFSNQFRGMLEKYMLTIKKDVFVFELNQEKLFNEVLRKLFAEGQEKHIESILEYKERFRSLLNTMEANTKYLCEKGHFYKLYLHSSLPMYLIVRATVLVDNEDVSIRYTRDGILYLYVEKPAVKSFYIYNSKIERKNFKIGGNYEAINVTELSDKMFVVNDCLLVSYHH